MRFKSENQLREYWEKDRKITENEFLKIAEKEGKNKEDARVKQFFELFFDLFLVKELESVCLSFKEENRYRTSIEVSRHFDRVLKPIGDTMWEG